MKDTKEKYNEMTSDPVYLEISQGFPNEFLNYYDVLRLYNLINDNRAENMREAFNVLERQKHYEDEAAHRGYMEYLQRDIARSARIAAGTSILNASNSIYSDYY